MDAKTSTTSRLALFAAVLLLTTAIQPAWAQDKDKNAGAGDQTATESSDQPGAGEASDEPAAEESGDDVEVGAATAMGPATVDIPTIETTDSSIDEATLRQILAGDIAGHAGDLAALNATNITVPEITVSMDVPVEGGEPVTASFTYSDITFDNVVDGVAETVGVGSISYQSGPSSGSFDAMTVNDLSIGGLLAFYGLVEAADAETMQTIMSSFSMGGGTMTGPGLDCSVGAVSGGEYKARPLKVSIMDIIALAPQLEAQGENPSPETIAKIVNFYADFLYAFETQPATLDSIACDMTDPGGKAMHFSMGPSTVDGFTPGRYPGLTMTDFNITSGADDGRIGFSEFTLKGFDVSGLIAAIQEAGSALDKAWFEANARKLIPAFEGFFFSGLDIDVPEPNSPEKRVTLGVGEFDLTLADYVNGIPSNIDTSASNVVMSLPTDSIDPQVQALIAAGLTEVDAGFALQTHWDQEAQTIAIDNLSVSGADLGEIQLIATLGNATEALFATDSAEAMAAGMGVTVKEIHNTVTDEGFLDIVFTALGAQQGQPGDVMRAQMSAVAKMTIVQAFTGAENVVAISTAISDFIAGKTSLSIDITAKDPAGVGAADFMAAQNDPKVLTEKFDIQAVAE